MRESGGGDVDTRERAKVRRCERAHVRTCPRVNVRTQVIRLFTDSLTADR